MLPGISQLPQKLRNTMSLGIYLSSIRTITSLSIDPEAEFPSDLESRMWDRLTASGGSHTVAMAVRRRSLQERRSKGRRVNIKAWACRYLGDGISFKRKGLSETALEFVCFFLSKII